MAVDDSLQIPGSNAFLPRVMGEVARRSRGGGGQYFGEKGT